MSKNAKTMKIDNDVLERLNKIKIERLKMGLDKAPLPPKRLIRAALRIPNVEEILKKSVIEK